jgi:hypothetical protein
MLWMKNWMETRWRFALMFAVFSFIFVSAYLQLGDPAPPNPVPEEERVARILSIFSFVFVLQAVTLAGAGIKTQAPFQLGRGLHGSMHFTLSLPVSRLRLLATRTGLGALELCVGVFLGAAGLALVVQRQFPERPFLLSDTFAYAVTFLACLGVCFGISVVLSTFLDDAWQMWGSLILLGAIRGLSATVKIPENFDPFRAIGSASPFITHTISWGAVAVCMTSAAALWLVAARIVQTRDY